jgi:5-methylcytosine-specific restriction endonuclease McrA
MNNKHKDEPLWCKMYRKEILKPKMKQRDTEITGRSLASQSGFYNTRAWKILRATHISNQPLCVMCEEIGRLNPAKIVDHIQSVDEAPGRALDKTNLQSLCEWHHTVKTNNDKKLKNINKKKERGKVLMKQFESPYPVGGGCKK